MMPAANRGTSMDKTFGKWSGWMAFGVANIHAAIMPDGKRNT
jgi:hypothetical protein